MCKAMMRAEERGQRRGDGGKLKVQGQKGYMLGMVQEGPRRVCHEAEGGQSVGTGRASLHCVMPDCRRWSHFVAHSTREHEQQVLDSRLTVLSETTDSQRRRIGYSVERGHTHLQLLHLVLEFVDGHATDLLH